MNELDLIRSFRADVPGPSAAATARADRAWRRTTRRRVSRWAPRVAAATAAVAAVAAAALIVPSGDEGRLGAHSAEAAQTLRHAAAEVRGLPRPLKPGEYWYVRSTTRWTTGVEGTAGAYTAIGLETREEWIAPDGSRRWITRQVGPLGFPSARDRERWEADGRPDLMPSSPSEDRTRTGFHIGTRKHSYRQLLALPRDPRILYERFHDAAVECQCGNGVDDQTFVVAIELLRTTPLPDDLRAAILRAIALIPGIEQHAERDVLGRPGVSVAYNGSQGRQALIFDPSTYEMLGDRSGAGGTADIESGIVDSMTERP
jgi:RNA polymerase sigma-70 factor (ECF subfamily)